MEGLNSLSVLENDIQSLTQKVYTGKELDRVNTFYKEHCEIVEKELSELEAYKKLEEQIGCPLEVRVLLFRGEHVFGEGCMYEIINIDESGFWAEEIVRNGECLGERFLPYKEYKKAWWLEPDKSE